MRPINPLLLIDFYKAGHRAQYPEDTTLVYSNFTPRVSRVPGVESMVFYGLQYAVQEYLIDRFGRDFFARPKAEVVDEYRDFMDCTLGPGAVACDHIEALWDLGYLPVEIRALPEGTHVPMGVPALTIHNTQPDFFWLPNYLETLLSCLLWKPCTTATTAGQFFQNFIRYAEATGGDLGFVPFQGHDFSFRGMSLPEDGIVSGSAHLLWFTGTDTVPAIRFHELYYGADRHRELVGCSVSATEHSVMSAGGNDQEFETYKRLLTEVYPHGIVSIVSDTWDFWAVVTDFLPRLKGEIFVRGENAPTAMNKLVIRPDSGVPHKIINGDPTADTPCASSKD
jgi:nicotinamide phosphoribosyltransferase